MIFPMRRSLRRGALLVLTVCACSSWRNVERVEWRRVFAQDEVKRTPDARQEIISRDKYEEEVAAGVHRAYEPPPGFQSPFLHETDGIGLKLNEVMEFRVDESEPVDLQLTGECAEVFWAPMVKKDEWKGDEGVTKKLSLLLVRAAKPGKGTLRLLTGASTKDVPVTVTAK